MEGFEEGEVMKRRGFLGGLFGAALIAPKLKLELPAPLLTPPLKKSIFDFHNGPAFPDSVALRGTKEWREAFRVRDEWIQKQLKSGATPKDLGLKS